MYMSSLSRSNKKRNVLNNMLYVSDNMYKISIGSWNIDGGLGVKHNIEDFTCVLRKHDIFCVQETWLYESNIINIPDYLPYRSDRTKKRKARRGSGGVMLFYKKSLSKGLNKIESANPDCLWVKMDKHYFGTEQDIYLCNSYIVPRNSTYYKHGDTDVIGILRDEITKFTAKGHVLVIGDLNSRLGQTQESLCDQLLYDQDPDKHDYVHVRYRYNMDKHTNDNGNDLMNIINDAHMIVANGRTPGDIHGDYTYHGPHGSSAIDLCISSMELYGRIQYFRVNKRNVLSHHCTITVMINIKQTPHHTIEPGQCTPFSKYMWDNDSRDLFTQALLSEDNTKKLHNYCNASFDNSNTAMEQLTNIIHGVAQASVPMKTISDRTKYKDNNRTNGPNIHNNEIQKAKRQFKTDRRAFRKDKSALDRWQSFLSAKKKYKNIIYHIHKQAKEKNIRKLAT